MRIHYVEDNERDAAMLTNMVGTDGDIQLNISERMEDFLKSSKNDKTDFVLLDVRRPDAVSIEDDIRRVRSYTDAPIVFVTSGNAEGVRREAFVGGAEAVIDKGDLNKNLLRQLFLNSSIRHRMNQEVPEDRIQSREMKTSIETLTGPFAYVELSLQTLLEVMEDAGRTNTAEYVAHLLETVKAIRAYSQDDLSKSTRTPIHELLIETAERMSRTAKKRGVDLILETEASWFTQMGSQPLASLGIQHMIAGLLRACEKGDRMAVRSERDENGIALNIFVSRDIIPSKDALFDLTQAGPHLGPDSKASIQLALTVLAISPEQADVHIHKGNLFIKLLI
ncbi:MAG: hypothetical protein CMK09_16525 [Ponticaulis sp.]|nr:hypothetical protein [Ponticaulis sp.]|tara:strand:- start:8282 stop:9292 length:1011 start_codon:yes stop_codon:yes gene_type:complete